MAQKKQWNWIFPHSPRTVQTIEEAKKCLPKLEVIPSLSYATKSSQIRGIPSEACPLTLSQENVSRWTRLKDAQVSVYDYYAKSERLSYPVNPLEIFQKLQEEYLKLLKLSNIENCRERNISSSYSERGKIFHRTFNSPSSLNCVLICGNLNVL